MKQSYITPAFDANNVAVFYQVSDLHAPYCAVSIASLLHYVSPKHNYDIVILCQDMTDENKMLLGEVVQGVPNVSLRFFDTSEVMAPLRDRLPSTDWFRQIKLPIEIVCSYFAAQEIFNGYEKVIRLGADTMLKDDIAKLYDKDIGENWIGAVRDIGLSWMLRKDDFRLWYERKFGMDYETMAKTYINVDVMVLNLAGWRSNDVKEKLLIAGADTTNGEWHLIEQDVANYVCHGHIHCFGWEWNCYPRSELILSYMQPEDVKQNEKARENPSLVHFSGGVDKPWNDPSVQFAADWWRCAKETPFYELLINRMMEKRVKESEKRVKEMLRQDIALIEVKRNRMKRLRRRRRKYKLLSWMPFGIGKKARKKVVELSEKIKEVRESLYA